MYKSLKQTGESNLIRFCMPGHKGKPVGSCLDAVKPYDFTELEITDNLFAPEGIIKSSEQKTAKLFNSKISCYSASGATPLVKASLYLTCKNGSVLAMRGSHISFFDGAALCRSKVRYVYSQGNEPFCVPTACDFEKELEKERFDAVFITSPNYYGILADVEGIAKVCKKHGALLIVDNSHGCHLNFLDGGKNHPLYKGADIVIDSAHKTLPVLTGGAIIHCNADFSTAQIKRAISLFASTSPSYLILNSIDYALELCAENSQMFDLAAKRINAFKQKLTKEGFCVLKTEPMRITLQLSKSNIDAIAFNKCLLREYNIACEMADRDNLVLIMSPFDSDDDLEKLFCALCELKKREWKRKAVHSGKIPYAKPVIELYEALFESTQEIDIKNAQGKICASHINVCPPCIPIAAAGELITKEIIDYISKNTDIEKISIIDR